MIAHKEKFFLSVLLLSTSSLLGFFEFQAFRALDFSFHLALSMTVVLQAILICLEVLCSLCKQAFKRAFLGFFIFSVAAFGLSVMNHHIGKEKLMEEAEISNNSQYKKDLDRLKWSVQKFELAYASAFESKNFANANKVEKHLIEAKKELK